MISKTFISIYKTNNIHWLQVINRPVFFNCCNSKFSA